MKSTYLKLCGNHSLQDLERSINEGAPFIGIIFAESKRKVDPIQCGEWMRKVDKQAHQKYVGVFVNPTLTDILHVLRYVPLDIIQFHGTEPSSEIMIAKKETGLAVWKAIHHDENGINKMKDYYNIVDGFVIDSKVQGAWGGTGVRFDWEAIPTYTKEAERQGVLCLIAGGITPENTEQILAFAPQGIDISSGIETNGEKDSAKIQKLVEKLKNYDANKLA